MSECGLGWSDVTLDALISMLLSLQLVQDLLASLPQMFGQTMETQSALGPALQAAFKLLSPTGGRMSVFQTQLPTLGIGALKPREEPSAKVCLLIDRLTDPFIIYPGDFALAQ